MLDSAIDKADFYVRRNSDVGLESGGKCNKLERLGLLATQKQRLTSRLISRAMGLLSSRKPEDKVVAYAYAVSYLLIKKYSGPTVHSSFRKPRSRFPSLTQLQIQGIDEQDFGLANRMKQQVQFAPSQQPTSSERRIKLSGPTESPDNSVNEKKYDQMVYNICKVKRNFEFAEMEPVLKSKLSKGESSKGGIDSPLKQKISKFAPAQSVFVSKKLTDEESSKSLPMPQTPKPNRVDSVELEEEVEILQPKVPSLETRPALDPQLSNSTESVRKNCRQPSQNPVCSIKAFYRPKDRMPTLMIKHDITRRSRTYLDTPEVGGFGNANQLETIESGAPRQRHNQKKVTAISSQAETHPSERKLTDTDKAPALQNEPGKQKPFHIPKMKDFLHGNIISKCSLFTPTSTPRGLVHGSQTQRSREADPYLIRTNLPRFPALKQDPLGPKKKPAQNRKKSFLIKSTV